MTETTSNEIMRMTYRSRLMGGASAFMEASHSEPDADYRRKYLAIAIALMHATTSQDCTEDDAMLAVREIAEKGITQEQFDRVDGLKKFAWAGDTLRYWEDILCYEPEVR